RPAADRPRWWRRRDGNSGVPPGAASGLASAASPAASPGTSPVGSPGLNHDASHALNHAGSHAGNSGGMHAAGPCRIGDSIVHPDIDGSPTLSAEAYACGFIEYLQQHPALRGLLGDGNGWISSRSLERRYYPSFLAGIVDAPLPYRTIAIALAKITE